jgi:hypothetical protein
MLSSLFKEEWFLNMYWQCFFGIGIAIGIENRYFKSR